MIPYLQQKHQPHHSNKFKNKLTVDYKILIMFKTIKNQEMVSIFQSQNSLNELIFHPNILRI